jgi:putative ABC transport system permease protein
VALGASRIRIVRQFMTESVLLAVAGALAGVAVAYAAMSAAAALMPDLRMVLPRGEAVGLTRVGLARIGLDFATMLFTAAAAGGAALLFGLAPAWRASRRDLSTAIKGGSLGAIAQGTRGFSGRNALVVGEMALALVLLTASGLMLKSVARLQATQLGFVPESLLSVRVALPAPQYDAERGTRYFEQLLGRLDARTEMDSIAYGSCAPLAGPCNRTSVSTSRGKGPVVGVYWISPTYLDTLGIRLIRGRGFTEFDRVGQPKVVLINETAARTLWPNEDPLGKRASLGQGGFQDGAEVVGIVADVRYGMVEAPVIPDFYLPVLQSRRTMGVIFVRSGAPAASIVAAIRSDVQALDPDLPLTDIKMMGERFKDATWRTRVSAWLLGVFASLALVLAALGTYGVMSQGVEQRRKEIGVRMALGAGRREILRLIIGRVVAVAIAGIVLGVALAVPAMKLLTALLYQVRPGDPWVFAGLAFVLLTVTLLAGYIPARRATRVDPLTTLRSE